MKPVYHSLVITLFSVVVSVVGTHIGMFYIGPDYRTEYLILATIIPLIISLPVSLYVFNKGHQLKLALLRLEQVNRELERVYEKTRYQARHDLMTGCLNRNSFFNAFSKHIRRDQQCALLLLDVDELKAINDRWGHRMGDEALTLFATALQDNLPKGSIIGRLGGDEFGVLIPKVSKRNALGMAKSLCASIGRLALHPDAEQPHFLSASIGLKMVGQGMSAQQVVAMSDRAMYQAKRLGGNQVKVDELPFDLEMLSTKFHHDFDHSDKDNILHHGKAKQNS